MAENNTSKMAAEETPATVAYQPNTDMESGAVTITSPAQKQSAPVTVVSHRKNSRIPILFERAAKSWWNPSFDSRILERHHTKTYFQQICTWFRYALGYIILSCVAWIVLFVCERQPNWQKFVIGSGILVVLTVAVLGLTFTKAYKKFVVPTSVVMSLCLSLFCLLSFVYPNQAISAVGAFIGSIEIILMIYTVIPLPLYLSVLIAVLHSVLFEVISALKTEMIETNLIVARSLLHLCIHIIGVHIFIMSQVRKRSTFLKVGQSIMSRKTLEFEKQLKHQMIHSLMPQKVAEEVMKARGQDDKREDEVKLAVGSPSNSLNFRSFHMSQMDHVSILFADIVGFTKMSSNKTAELLVSLLNDLFGRFDILCAGSGCEKISTLGDCYYCVSGCPTPKLDHAHCCVRMGLSMCKAIEEFDADHNEEVDMRVGVHTGTVLCGLVGTRRFKFDVWSHDVTLANIMESSGQPGRVHISAATKRFVEDIYELDVGEEVKDIRNTKKLTECFDPETQQYIVKHVEEANVIETFFVKGMKEGVNPETVAQTAMGDGTTPETTTIQITVDQEEDKGKDLEKEESESIMPKENSEEKSQTNHLEVSPPIEANEMSTTSLLGKRENLGNSIEDQDTDNKETTDTGLMDVLLSPRLHEQSDKQLISHMETDCARAEEYLYRPPINKCTLKFTDDTLEHKYRTHYIDDQTIIRTLALPKFSALCDMIVSCTFLVLVAISCFLALPISTVWIVVFVIEMCYELLMLIPLLAITCTMKISVGRLKQFFSSWFIRHLFGCLIASLPPVAVYANFNCSLLQTTDKMTMFYCLLLVATLLHYCNFTMLSSWMKSTLATVAAVILLVLLSCNVCQPAGDPAVIEYLGKDGNLTMLLTTEVPAPNTTAAVTLGLSSTFTHEIFLDVILFLVLLWFLNREFEISYRLAFHGNQQALLDRQEMQEEKESADWLLHNIIPEHVADILKKTSKYCENHKDVGVVFASVTNFDNFYDESYEGGKEYLRVLNELMGDFEELFDNPKYKDIEKIKTIGSCLMAAAGLNPRTRQQNKDPNSHLYALMDFCSDLLEKLEQFNSDLLNFDFEIKIGFNYGDVTSGVIGTTKLLYDIWGDTVNISSRMYSTGVQGKVQVTGLTAAKLQDKFEFEYRDKIFVKGKGDMDTYIMAHKKPNATWD